MAEPCEGQANWSEAEEERERSQQGKENIWKKKHKKNKTARTTKMNEKYKEKEKWAISSVEPRTSSLLRPFLPIYNTRGNPTCYNKDLCKWKIATSSN